MVNLKTLLKMTCQLEKDKQCLALLLEEHTITKPTEAQPGKGKMGIFKWTLNLFLQDEQLYELAA